MSLKFRNIVTFKRVYVDVMKHSDRGDWEMFQNNLDRQFWELLGY